VSRLHRPLFGMALALALAATVACSTAGGAAVAGSPRPSVAPTSPSPVASVDPNFDSGQNIFITPAGFHPHWLVAPLHGAITWHNETNRSQVIVFDHQQVKSGVIPPGGTFTYTPAVPISIAYHSALGHERHGVIQVQA